MQDLKSLQGGHLPVWTPLFRCEAPGKGRHQGKHPWWVPGCFCPMTWGFQGLRVLGGEMPRMAKNPLALAPRDGSPGWPGSEHPLSAPPSLKSLQPALTPGTKGGPVWTVGSKDPLRAASPWSPSPDFQVSG